MRRNISNNSWAINFNTSSVEIVNMFSYLEKKLAVAIIMQQFQCTKEKEIWNIIPFSIYKYKYTHVWIIF